MIMINGFCYFKVLNKEVKCIYILQLFRFDSTDYDI